MIASLSFLPSIPLSLTPPDKPRQFTDPLTTNELATVAAHVQDWTVLGTQLQMSEYNMSEIKV